MPVGHDGPPAAVAAASRLRVAAARLLGVRLGTAPPGLATLARPLGTSARCAATAGDWREMTPDDDPFPDAPRPPEPPNGRRPQDEADLASIAARYTPVDWSAAFTGQPEDTDWLWGEFLERGTLNALFARPAVGKSLLALEIAVDVVRSGRTVVYLDEENRIIDLVDRLQAFGRQPEELERLRLYSFAGLPPLDRPGGGRHLLALAVTHGAALVVIDTASRMIGGPENDADTFLALYRCALAPLKAEGITVLRLDHPGKDESRGQRGSSAKDGDVDTAWRMATVTEGLTYRLERTKSRSGHGPPAWTLRRLYEPLRHDWASGGVQCRRNCPHSRGPGGA
jgi:AAA domain